MMRRTCQAGGDGLAAGIVTGPRGMLAPGVQVAFVAFKRTAAPYAAFRPRPAWPAAARAWAGWPGRAAGRRGGSAFGSSSGAALRRRIHPTQAASAARPTRIEHEYKRCGAWASPVAGDVRRARDFGRCDAQTGIDPFKGLAQDVLRRRPFCTAARSSGSPTTAHRTAARPAFGGCRPTGPTGRKAETVEICRIESVIEMTDRSTKRCTGGRE